MNKFLFKTKIKYKIDGIIRLKEPKFLDLERNPDPDIEIKFLS